MRSAFQDIAFLNANFEGSRAPIPDAVVLCFGKDGCAEHEWGIAPLERKLAVPLANDRRLVGVEARAILNTSSVVIIEGTTPKILASGRDPAIAPQPVMAIHLAPTTPYEGQGEGTGPLRLSLNKGQTKAFLERHKVNLRYHLDRPMSMWDEREAFFLVSGEAAVAAMANVLKGFEEEQGMSLSSRATGVFNSGGGICLSRLSAISEESKAAVKKVDEDHWELIDRVAASGIEEKLKAAGRKYYALSPRILDANTGELAFWLNPSEQKVHHYGWVSLSDLEGWATVAGGHIGQRAAQDSLSAADAEKVGNLTTRLSRLYGNPYSPLVVWADAEKSEAAVAISVGEKGIAAGLSHRQVVPLSQFENLVLKHEELAATRNAAKGIANGETEKV